MFLYLSEQFYFGIVGLKLVLFVRLNFLKNWLIFLISHIIFCILSYTNDYLHLHHLSLILHIYHITYYQVILNKFNTQ